MSKLIPSLTNLQQERAVKMNSRNAIFSIVLGKCVEKIVYTNKHTDKTFIIFEVPQVLIDYPSYDLRSCIIFIKLKLESEGYMVEFIEPFYLYIDWGGNPKKVEITSQSSNNLGVRCLDPERLKQQTKKLLLNFPNANEIEYVYQDVQDTKDHKKPKGKPKLKKK